MSENKFEHCEECKMKTKCIEDNNQHEECSIDQDEDYVIVETITFTCGHEAIAERYINGNQHQIYCGNHECWYDEGSTPCFEDGKCEYCEA